MGYKCRRCGREFGFKITFLEHLMDNKACRDTAEMLMEMVGINSEMLYGGDMLKKFYFWKEISGGQGGKDEKYPKATTYFSDIKKPDISKMEKDKNIFSIKIGFEGYLTRQQYENYCRRLEEIKGEFDSCQFIDFDGEKNEDQALGAK